MQKLYAYFRNIDIRHIIATVYIAGIVTIFVAIRTFWTPDIMFLILLGLFLILGQARSFITYFLPFVALILSYEKLRSLATHINKHVHYMEMVHVDRWLTGGTLPTAWLQQHWYHGHVAWYDFYFYFLYMMHFVVPVVLAVIIWKYRTKEYWFYITALVILSYGGFLTYVLFPAAPPWLASNLGKIEPIHRISSDVWAAFGVKNFSAYYQQLSPNPVAAMPSLHAAYPLLFTLIVRKLWGNRAFLLTLFYPISIWIGIVYLGEHYVVDALAGILYAILAYLSAPYVLRFAQKMFRRIMTLHNPILVRKHHG